MCLSLLNKYIIESADGFFHSKPSQILISWKPMTIQAINHRVNPDISARDSHRTVRISLYSHGSYYSTVNRQRFCFHHFSTSCFVLATDSFLGDVES